MDVLGLALETGLNWQLNSIVSRFYIGLFPFLLPNYVYLCPLLIPIYDHTLCVFWNATRSSLSVHRGSLDPSGWQGCQESLDHPSRVRCGSDQIAQGSLQSHFVEASRNRGSTTFLGNLIHCWADLMGKKCFPFSQAEPFFFQLTDVVCHPPTCRSV